MRSTGPAPTRAPTPDGVPPLTFLVFLGAAGLLLAAVFLGLIVGTASYEEARAFNQFIFHDEAFISLGLPLSPARFNWLRGILAAGGLLGLGTALATWQSGQALKLLWLEGWRAWQRMRRRWGRLPLAARLIAGGLLALLVAARTWYLLQYPLGPDEIASHDYFVQPGLLAITSFYPIPNNHLFFNLLAWPFAQTGLSPRLVMRLPTLLFGTLGTVAGYALLARMVGLRLATLVTGLVGLTPLWVYYGAAGRGYFVQLGLLQLGFYAVLELLRPQSAYQRLSWAVFIGSSMLGLYTIPTYAYPLAGLFLGLAGGLWATGRRPYLGHVVLAGTLIGLLSLLLYLPVGMVSGWEQLLANRYIVTKTAAQFFVPFRAILYETAAELFGPSLRLSGPAWLGGGLLGWWVIRRLIPAGPTRTLALLAWVLLAIPLPLMALQRVIVPTRALLYVTLAGYLLAVLACARLRPWRALPTGGRWPLVLALVLGIGGLRLYRHQEQLQASRQETQNMQQAYRWLQTRHQAGRQPTRVWLNAPLHELFFSHYLQQTGTRGLHLHSGREKVPASSFDYVVIDNYFLRKYQQADSVFRRVYHDRLVTIYAVKR